MLAKLATLSCSKSLDHYSLGKGGVNAGSTGKWLMNNWGQSQVPESGCDIGMTTENFRSFQLLSATSWSLNFSVPNTNPVLAQ